MSENTIAPYCRYCNICDEDVPKNSWDEHLSSTSHKENANLFKKKIKEKYKSIKIKAAKKRNFEDIDFETDDYLVEKSEEALQKCFLTLRIIPKKEIKSIYVLIEELPYLMYEKMKEVLYIKKSIKLKIIIYGKFAKFQPAIGNCEYQYITVASSNKIIEREDDINNNIEHALNEINIHIENWDNNEGYWHLELIDSIYFKLREYKPLTGTSYIKLPEWILAKKATINIKNNDQKCFKYCMSCHKHKDEITHNPERISWYKNWNDYDYKGIKFPISVEDIKKFCKQNDISINVYIVKGKEILPYLTIARDMKKDDHVNLLLIENEDGDNIHYIYIKSLSRLVRSQLTKYEHHHFICERCFYHTNKLDLFTKHQSLCDNYFMNEEAVPVLPKDSDNIPKFKNFKKTFRVPLVYYADLEAVLRKLDNVKYFIQC